LNKDELEKLTRDFALRVIRLVANLPKNKITDVLGYQLLKSGTSIGANYREANRAESKKDFIHKIGIVTKEAAETQYWLELFAESRLEFENTESKLVVVKREHLDNLSWLLNENGELLAIFTAIGKSSKRR
jgi:four helix bundle protein